MESEHGQTKAKKQASTGGRSQDSNEKLPSNSERAKGTGGIGGELGDVDQRNARPNWAEKNPFGIVGQQVINRLRCQTEDRLTEARACVTWYEEQVEKLIKELEEIDQIKQTMLENLTKEE